VKTFEALIQYRTPEGSLENGRLVITSNSKADAKKAAKQIADERANRFGGRVLEIIRKESA
jgi:hypothetical protein